MAKLPADEGKWTINLPDSDGSISAKGNAFTITITFVKPIDLTSLNKFVTGARATPDEGEIESCIQAMNIILQHGPLMTYPHRGASFYLPIDSAGLGISQSALHPEQASSPSSH